MLTFHGWAAIISIYKPPIPSRQHSWPFPSIRLPRRGAGWLCREAGASVGKAWQCLPTSSDTDPDCAPAKSQRCFSPCSHVSSGKITHGRWSNLSCHLPRAEHPVSAVLPPTQGTALALQASGRGGAHGIPMGWNKLSLPALRHAIIIQTTFLWAS